MEDGDIEVLKDTLQDCNLNFLIGSGLSVPFFSTLGNIELMLTELAENLTLRAPQKTIIRASILGKYFEKVIKANPNIVDDTFECLIRDEVLDNYKTFLTTLNTIVLKRKSSIIDKQVNLFTTNIDVFFEKALETIQVEYNDGFSGRFNPIFNLTNFKKSYFTKSMHYGNSSEIPVFNLLKVHGSLTWSSSGDKIYYSNLKLNEEVEEKWSLVKNQLIDFQSDCKLEHFSTEVVKVKHDSTFNDFLKSYDKLAVVNPTKQKFQDTILNLNYYELLRLFANELEKENTLLFVLGFSLADEHIREIILRAANSNPTLLIKVFAYDSKAKSDIENNIYKGGTTLRYDNIRVLEPKAGVNYNFKMINSVFKSVLQKVN